MKTRVQEANDAIAADPVGMGGYTSFYWWPNDPEPFVCLDGDYDLEDLRRLLTYMERIHEDVLK